MSNAKKCDRCGNLYEDYDGYEVTKKGNKYDKLSLRHHWKTVARDYDLCPKCMKSLVKWLKEADDECIR